MPAGDRIFWSDVADAVRPPIVHLVQQVAQTAWVTATANAITFGAGSEVIDSATFHDTGANTSRITIGGKLGWWEVSGLYCPASNAAATGHRAYLAKNGAALAGSFGGQGANAGAVFLGVTTARILVEATAAGDYVELFGYMVAPSGTLGTSFSSYVASSLTATWKRPS